MMLVISVIVAIAILGILLGFLGNVSIIGAEATQVLPGMVKDVYSQGTMKVEKSIEFKDGVVLEADKLTQDSFSDILIYVQCSESAEKAEICGDSDENSLQIIGDEGEGQGIAVNKKYSASVAVCEHPDSDKTGAYLIVLGIKNEITETRDVCLG